MKKFRYGALFILGTAALACSGEGATSEAVGGGGAGGLDGLGVGGNNPPGDVPAAGHPGFGAGGAPSGFGGVKGAGGFTTESGGSVIASGGYAPSNGGFATGNGGIVGANGGFATGYGGFIGGNGGFATGNGGFIGGNGGFATGYGGFIGGNGGFVTGNGGFVTGNGGFVTGMGGNTPSAGGKPSPGAGGAPHVCTPNAATCNGNTLRKCNLDGTGYASSTVCTESCDSSTSTCKLCHPGDSYCDGNTSVTCDSTGHTLLRNPCAKLCIGPGICGQCTAATAQRDCPTTDPCQVPSCNTSTNACQFKEAAINDTCSMTQGYGGCTRGGCLGFCTDRGSCDPVVVIKANVNGKYVTLTSDGYLLASASSKASAARFAVHVDPRNAAYEMAFYSLDSSSYIAVDSPNIPLETGAGAIAAPEVFTNLDGTGNYDPSGAITDVTMSFYSQEASKYVTAEDSGASPLIANRDAVGPWEQFTLEFASP